MIYVITFWQQYYRHRSRRRSKRQACVEVASSTTTRPLNLLLPLPLPQILEPTIPLLPVLPLLPTLPIIGAGVGAAIAGAVVLPGWAWEVLWWLGLSFSKHSSFEAIINFNFTTVNVRFALNRNCWVCTKWMLHSTAQSPFRSWNGNGNKVSRM